jgi:general nucleoside transport system permease protein
VSDPGGRDGRGSVAEVRRKINLAFDLQPVLVPLYALITAVVIGGLLVAAIGKNPFDAYWALLRGMVGSGDRLAASLSRSTPYIGSALALAFAFRAGLFNIGVEGQLLMGGVVAAWVATLSWVADVPAPIAIPIVLISGILGGAAWGGIPGVLRVKTGAHEVISTIMLNNIAILLVRWLVNSQDPIVLRDATSSVPRTEPVADSARLPELVNSQPRLHIGLFIALAMCFLVWFVLHRTIFGFEVRTVGANPNAARYAGVSVNRVIVASMAISGALAGLMAAGEVQGTSYFYQPGFFANVGFDGIAIALLARANPFAIIPAALLWGGMLSGAGLMQQEAGVSIDVVRIVQALVLLLVAADAIVRYVFHVRRHAPATLATGAAAIHEGSLT